MENAQTGNRAVITVIGVDRIGIIAGMSAILAEHSVNILDISMTVLQEFFAMILVADLSGSTLPFQDLLDKLDAKGKEIGVRVNVQREEIFKMMHRI